MAAPIVVCTPGAAGAPRDETREALTLGQRIAAARSAELRWLILGALPDGAAEVGAAHGVVAIDHAAGPEMEALAPDTVVATIAAYCEANAPYTVVLPQTFEMKVIAPRVAGRLGTGIVINCVDAQVSGDGVQVTAATFGGDTRATFTFAGETPYFISLTPRAIEAAAMATPGAMPAVNNLALASGVTERVRVLKPATSSGPRLEDAQIVVSGGRGLGQVENYKLIEELAQAVGGMSAASRPIVDDGWVDSSRQVGLTGRITKPDLYIAVGISGASQHMAGCSAAKVIVAINRDQQAPIFRHAKYGIVGDFAEIMPALIKAAQNQPAPQGVTP